MHSVPKRFPVAVVLLTLLGCPPVFGEGVKTIMKTEDEHAITPFRAKVTKTDEKVNVEVFNLMCPSFLRVVSSSVSDMEGGATKSIRVHFDFRSDGRSENEEYQVSFDRNKTRKILLSIKYPHEYIAEDVLIWKRD
jgi:hypothetical protein